MIKSLSRRVLMTRDSPVLICQYCRRINLSQPLMITPWAMAGTKNPAGEEGVAWRSLRRWFQTGLSLTRKQHHEYPELDETELEEEFVQGSGPGGQSVNRTMNCVVLKHRPTGLVVKCHESRSLITNRRRARERLQQRLDFHYHGDDSYLSLKKKEDSENRKMKKRKARLRLEKKRAFKEREKCLEAVSDDDSPG